MYTRSNKYSDIRFIANDGVTLYYSKFLIEMSDCEYLQSLSLGAFSESGKESLIVNMSSGALNTILTINAGINVDHIEEGLDEIIEFCQMACWYRPFRQNLDSETIIRLKPYYVAIVNMYPELIKYYKDVPLFNSIYNHIWINSEGVVPEIIKYGFKGILQYVRYNSQSDTDIAIRYFIESGEVITSELFMDLITIVSDEKLALDILKIYKQDL